MDDTIFGKIIRREIPADIVYEDDETLAFLDITPVNPGHTLVIPKKAARNVLDIDAASWGKVMETVRKIAPAVKAATEADGINLMMNNEAPAGQVVFHAHVHIIPRFKNDGYELWHGASYPPLKAKEMAQKIQALL